MKISYADFPFIEVRGVTALGREEETISKGKSYSLILFLKYDAKPPILLIFDLSASMFLQQE